MTYILVFVNGHLIIAVLVFYCVQRDYKKQSDLTLTKYLELITITYLQRGTNLRKN